MGIKQQLAVKSSVLKGHVDRYAILGLVVSIASIVVASLLVSFQLTGSISLDGILAAQMSNPAIWALDITPLMFAYWGQAFCYELASKAESIIEDKTREYATKSVDLEIRLKYETSHDSLTNLPNARLLSEKIKEGFTQIPQGENLAVIALHIKEFNQINAQYGSVIANKVLVQFADKLKSALLQPFMLQAHMGMNMAARLHGAEFALLIPRLRQEHEIDVMLKGLIDLLKGKLTVDGQVVPIDITAGIAFYDHGDETDTELLHHAALALLEAEKSKKAVEFYEASSDEQDAARQLQERALQEALETNQLTLSFQPEVEIKEKRLSGAKVLLNLEQEEMCVLEPGSVATLSLGPELSAQLDRHVLRAALAQLRVWEKSKIDVPIKVMLLNSADESLPSFLLKLIKEYNVDATRITLLLNEGALLSEQRAAGEVMRLCHDMGMKLGISDFGSHDVSINYVVSFPVDQIELDASLTNELAQDENKQKLVKAILAFTHSLELKTCADEVSDEQTMTQLAGWGCSCGQGSAFYEPLSAKDMTALLSKSA